MVRLTAELIENAPQFTNAIKDRELDLHGYKFPAIENMGSTLDQFDTIDLSGNEIRKLDGFPLLKRLKALILTNNKIVRIAEDLGQQLPYLNTLILTSNGFSELRELDPLATCDKLTFLTLTHCPVTMRANYRLYVISLLPALRFLDYKRVTQSERRIAHSMFKRLPALASGATNAKGAPNPRSGIRAQNATSGTTTVKTFIPGAPLNAKAGSDKENGEPVDSQTSGTEPRDASNMPPPPAPVHPGTKRPIGNAQDLYAIQEAIKRARTMDEVDRLHQLLSSGQFAGFAIQWQQQLRLQQQQNQQQRQQEQQQQFLQQQPQSQPEQQQQQVEEAQPVEGNQVTTGQGDDQQTDESTEQDMNTEEEEEAVNHETQAVQAAEQAE